MFIMMQMNADAKAIVELVLILLFGCYEIVTSYQILTRKTIYLSLEMRLIIYIYQLMGFRQWAQRLIDMRKQLAIVSLTVGVILIVLIIFIILPRVLS